jgi:hypothetical protein
MELLFISDASHGWLRVKKSEVVTSGFSPSKSSYSDEEYYYLEEDDDAFSFLRLDGECRANPSEMLDKIPEKYVEDFRKYCLANAISRIS